MADLMSLAEVKKVVREIVSETPRGFVYERPRDADRPGGHGSCVYTNPDGSPSCIVGHFMDRINHDRPKWGDDDNRLSLGANTFGMPLTRDAYQWLYRVQRRQDAGYTWRKAIG